MERRGRIPVAKFRNQESKTRSRSRVREPDYNETDPETDLFTLLEDNIALKEDNKSLKLQIEEQKKNCTDVQSENANLKKDIDDLKRSNENFELAILKNNEKLLKYSSDRITKEKSYKESAEKIKTLTDKIKEFQENQKNLSGNLIQSNVALKEKIAKIFPTLANAEMESFVDIENEKFSNIVTAESVERIIEEFSQMKNTLNSVELQLYEANEKIADLVENQHHLEEEAETLRMENSNLTRVAQLLTENMKESVKTSKKMESALIKLKLRNDDLVKHNKDKDTLDAPQSPSLSPTAIESVDDELKHVQEELQDQNREHGERIVEMKALVEDAIKKSTNDDIKILQLKLEIMEKELQNANARAERAESELLKYTSERRISSKNTSNSNNIDTQSALPPPPPPPPPPSVLLYSPSQHAMNRNNDKVTRTLHENILAHNLKSGNTEECNTHQSNQQVEATGLDALVREFKEGKVTLRRARRKTRTNDALQEMFQVIEISKKRNRNSQILIDMHI